MKSDRARYVETTVWAQGLHLTDVTSKMNRNSSWRTCSSSTLLCLNYKFYAKFQVYFLLSLWFNSVLLCAYLNKNDNSGKRGFSDLKQPPLTEIIDSNDLNLFHAIYTNPSHCLYPLLPPSKNSGYNLRKRGHNLLLPKRDDRNFINRVLYRFVAI